MDQEKWTRVLSSCFCRVTQWNLAGLQNIDAFRGIFGRKFPWHAFLRRQIDVMNISKGFGKLDTWSGYSQANPFIGKRQQRMSSWTMLVCYACVNQPAISVLSQSLNRTDTILLLLTEINKNNHSSFFDYLQTENLNLISQYVNRSFICFCAI